MATKIKARKIARKEIIEGMQQFLYYLERQYYLKKVKTKYTDITHELEYYHKGRAKNKN